MVREDGHTIRDSFAQMVCEENEVSGVIKAFWLSKGDKLAGSMAVFPASVEKARRMIENRLVKIGGQIALAGEFRRVPRPIQVLQL